MEEKKEEIKLSYLDEIRAERDNLVKLKEEISAERVKIQELRTNEILSGNSTGGKHVEKKIEISPLDYAKAALKGQILK